MSRSFKQFLITSFNESINEEEVKPFTADDYFGFQGAEKFPNGDEAMIGEVPGDPNENGSVWIVIAGGNSEIDIEPYSVYVQYQSDEHDDGDIWAVKSFENAINSDVIEVANIVLNGLKGKSLEDGIKLVKSQRFDYINAA